MKILLVDDEVPARERLRRLIDELGDGYIVIGEATNGEDAVAAASESEVDVVLLDQKMPGMTGLETAAALAALDPPPAVVLVTAYPDYALDAFEHNVADYLVKPVRRERLAAALERLPRTTRPQRVLIGKSSDDDGRRHLSAHYRGGVQTVQIEDVLYLLDGMGFAHGVDADALASTGQWLAEALGRPNGSKAGRARIASRSG